MGGKSGGGNDKMIRLQEQQAAEARTKDTARQSRIAQGLAGIRRAFEGSPIMGSRQATANYDWNKKGAGLPPGFTYTAASSARPATYSGGYVGNVGDNGGRYYSSTKGGRQTAPATAGSAAFITGPDGKVYRQGDAPTTYTESYDTGASSGGFDDNFFNKFRQGMVDYYMPQVERQYGDAKDELTYSLARAGTGRSSVAVDEAAKLAEQDRLNRADVVTKADQGAGALRSRVANERAQAEAQLYATEDPDVAASQALAAVKNISLATPDTTPLGDVFKTALIGGANTLGGFSAEKMKQRYGFGGKPATYVVSS